LASILEAAEAEFLAVVEPPQEEGAVVAEEEVVVAEEEEVVAEEVVVVEEEEEGALGADANPSLQSEEIHFMKFLFPKWFITTFNLDLYPYYKLGVLISKNSPSKMRA